MPSSRRRLPARLAVVAGLAGAAGVVSVPACTCATPSAEIDGGDLLGVFSHDLSRDGGRDGAADGGPRRGRGKHPRNAGDAGPAPASSAGAPGTPIEGARAPIEGACVAVEGTPDHDIRRTLGRPPCRGAQILEWKDAEGAPRYACVVSPPGVETRAPLPLIVFFHDPDDDPSSVDKKTALRKSGASLDLSGDPAHTGFIVLAPQGRHLHGGKRGSVFDTDYTGADNVDVATVDHFVAELDGKGLVDHRRVYTLGASYGGHMAATYAMMRADRVAAFAAFATDAPRASWSCGGPPPPGLVVYRACDGFFSCESVERWLRARDAAEAETAWLRLGAGNEEEPSCETRNRCTPKRSEGNHHRWPKGREGDILAFFARHTLYLGASAPAADTPPDDP
jgi:poly(3-hydroxybutyrate) depolymerase